MQKILFVSKKGIVAQSDPYTFFVESSIIFVFSPQRNIVDLGEYLQIKLSFLDISTQEI